MGYIFLWIAKEVDQQSATGSFEGKFGNFPIFVN